MFISICFVGSPLGGELQHGFKTFLWNGAMIRNHSHTLCGHPYSISSKNLSLPALSVAVFSFIPLNRWQNPIWLKNKVPTFLADLNFSTLLSLSIFRFFSEQKVVNPSKNFPFYHLLTFQHMVGVPCCDSAEEGSFSCKFLV